MIYDYFRVTGAHDTVLDNADLFTVALRNDDLQEFYTRWDENLLSMTKIPSDDILESLYKYEYESLRNSRPYWNLCNLEVYQKKAKPDYQRLKTKVTRRFTAESKITEFWRQKWEK